MSLVETLLNTAVADTELLKKNDAGGDDFAIPRTVDFTLIAQDEERALLVRDFVNDNQYGNASVQTVDDQFLR